MQRLRSFASGSAVAVLLLWTAGTAAAESPIGEVLGVRGAVFLAAGAGREALIPRQPVHRADTIIAQDGKAEILLNDGSIISVGSNSRLQLSQYEGTANGRLMARLRLLDGVLRLFVNRATGGGVFEIETETAVAAVRGTDWLIEAVPGRTGVAIIKGTIAVSGVGAQRQAVVLLQRPGDGVDVRRGEPPGPVHPWSHDRFAATLARATFH